MSLINAYRRGRMDFDSRTLFNMHFSHVELQESKEDLAGNGTMAKYIKVVPIWMNVDRPQSGGTLLPDNPKGRELANRLKRAIESGAAYCLIEIVKDVNGQTFVSPASLVSGRHMNADLKKLGYV